MSTPSRTTLYDEVAEASTSLITATIQDESGAVLPDTSLTTLTLTLFDEATDAVINAQSGTDILNANNGTVDGAGLLTMLLQATDNPIVTVGRPDPIEWHVALFEWTYGTKSGKHEVAFPVRNLTKV